MEVKSEAMGVNSDVKKVMEVKSDVIEVVLLSSPASPRSPVSLSSPPSVASL